VVKSLVKRRIQRGLRNKRKAIGKMHQRLVFER